MTWQDTETDFKHETKKVYVVWKVKLFHGIWCRDCQTLRGGRVTSHVGPWTYEIISGSVHYLNWTRSKITLWMLWNISVIFCNIPVFVVFSQSWLLPTTHCFLLWGGLGWRVKAGQTETLSTGSIQPQVLMTHKKHTEETENDTSACAETHADRSGLFYQK